MDKRSLINFVTSLENACADRPFAGDGEIVVFRHADTRKWFGVLLPVPRRYFGEGQGSEVCLNVKCPPELSAMLRQNYADILPAYHMNKEQWITVRLGGGVPGDEIENLLQLSRELTKKGRKVKER